jgi:hypothetical protein
VATKKEDKYKSNHASSIDIYQINPVNFQTSTSYFNMHFIESALVAFSLVAGVLSQAETIYLSNCIADGVLNGVHRSSYYSEIE